MADDIYLCVCCILFIYPEKGKVDQEKIMCARAV